MEASTQFERKLYRTLKNIDTDLIEEYMESFGLEPEKSSLGAKFKQASDTMTEDQFVAAMGDGDLAISQLSPIEIEVLQRGTMQMADSGTGDTTGGTTGVTTGDTTGDTTAPLPDDECLIGDTTAPIVIK